MNDLPLTEWISMLSTTAIVCIVAFILGGLIKGTLGVGLPLLAVPLMSLVVPSPTAIGLVAVPVVLSNIWQMVDSRKIIIGWTRFWPLICTQLISTVLTVRFTLSLSVKEMNLMVAFSMLLALVLMVFKPGLQISPRREKTTSAAVGLLSGLLGGISSLTGPVIITYLMALKLDREEFVGCISIIYLASALPLYSAMLFYGKINMLDLSFSAAALIPMAIGLTLGKLIRERISEKAFRTVLYVYLVIMSGILIIKSYN